MKTELSRRDFFGSAAGLAIAFYIPIGGPKAALAAPVLAAGKKALPPANAFLHIGTDDSVTVLLAHSEMGQGIWTGLPMVIAEELDCDWSKIRAEHAPAADVYKSPAFGMQMTGGSSTTNSEFDRYRTVGATAKVLLLQAAAAKFKTTPDKLKVDKGVISFGDQKVTFGQVADQAKNLKQPDDVKLKDPKDWKIIGTRVKRLDSPEKITGTAKFGMDVQFPGLRTAVVARPPAFGAKFVSVDDSAALKIPGVEKVVRTNDGVAVVAKNFWSAKLGRDALKIQWKDPEDGGVSSKKQIAEFRELAKKPGAPVGPEKGHVDDGLKNAKTKLDAEYDFPYLAHAPMEPLNCAVKIDGDKCEVWTGTQFQTNDQGATARILGIKPENVTIHTMFLGGAFGRRANFQADFVSEAVTIAKAAGVPVKTVWTREDDIRGGFYRPSYVHKLSVGVGPDGNPQTWDHVVVGQSIMSGTPIEPMMVQKGVDGSSVEGLADSPYLEKVVNKRVSLHSPKTAIPVLWWRSVGNTHTAFAMESMIDELAHAASKDPLAYRLALLEGKPRFAAALKLAAEKAGWGTPPPAGRARGLAVHESFGSIIAEVAEVSIDGKKIRVHAVNVAVDCGQVVNPLGVEAQIQGAVAFGLTAALHGKITLENGKPEQSNFHDYKPLRIYEMPNVSVHIVPSKAKMGGIGEPATAPIAPAVANAVFALTKQRLRSLPLVLATMMMLLLVACGGEDPKTPTQSGPPPTKEAGLAAYDTIHQVLQHPRCKNCHPGGDQPLQGDEGRVHDQFVQRGPEGKGAIGMNCTTCHGPANPPASYGEHAPPGEAKPWAMPPPDMKMVIVGMGPKDLCEQLKDPARNGHKDMKALRAHWDDPLVTWGWNPGGNRAPVPIPHEKLVAAFETWAAAGAPCPSK